MARKKKRMVTISAFLLVVGTVSIIYLSTYYPALTEAQKVVATMEEKNGDLYLEAENKTGFIIYPGGKVDERSYAVLAQMLNNKGYTVVIAKMPFRLSILNNNSAASIIEGNPDIESWVLIGHSLGGASASMFLHQHPDKIKGIVFLGSYPYKDLSAFDGFALSLIGSNDTVLNQEKAHEAINFYPGNSKQEIITGGNHAGFGCYGEQKGDGEAEITWQEQHTRTMELIMEMMYE